jgi:hypothetical protein
LVPFVQDSVEPGSVIHTDGWLGHLPVESKGYQYQVTFLKGKKKAPSELMPRVHLAISLLKRWLMGTHQGAVSHKHLDYYLDEFTFRFNRRRSKSRGKVFFRLAQQAVAVDPVTHYRIVHPPSAKTKAKPQSVGATCCRGYLSQADTHLHQFIGQAISLLRAVAQPYWNSEILRKIISAIKPRSSPEPTRQLENTVQWRGHSPWPFFFSSALI